MTPLQALISHIVTYRRMRRSFFDLTGTHRESGTVSVTGARFVEFDGGAPARGRARKALELEVPSALSFDGLCI